MSACRAVPDWLCRGKARKGGRAKRKAVLRRRIGPSSLPVFFALSPFRLFATRGMHIVEPRDVPGHAARVRGRPDASARPSIARGHFAHIATRPNRKREKGSPRMTSASEHSGRANDRGPIRGPRTRGRRGAGSVRPPRRAGVGGPRTRSRRGRPTAGSAAVHLTAPAVRHKFPLDARVISGRPGAAVGPGGGPSRPSFREENRRP